MQIIFYILKSMYILLGLIVVLIGKYLSNNIIVPRNIKNKIIDEDKYIKLCRTMFNRLGLYYIVLGFTLMFIESWPAIITYFSTFIPVLIIIYYSFNQKKYRTK
jgi:hypothetical protein